jgi:aspartyl protease family protein
MLKLALMAAMGGLSAVGAARAVVALDSMRDKPPIVASATMAAPVDTLAGGPSAASIVKSEDGHYWAEATVNGQRVRLLVDTGATAVALTIPDAQRLGMNPADLAYDAAVMTASGKARAARVQLASISIGNARVDNVDALVIEKGLDSSLLGMSYLGRLSRFEATPQAIILRP